MKVFVSLCWAEIAKPSKPTNVPLFRLFNLNMNEPSADSDASAFSDFDGNIAPFFKGLEKLGGLLRAGNGLVIHTCDKVTSPQPHSHEDALSRQFPDPESIGLSSSRIG